MPPKIYPSGLKVQAALAGVPPVELLVFSQVLVAPLKFSVNSTDGAQVKLELEVRLNGTPGHADIGLAPALTLGIGSTETVMVKGLLVHPPVVAVEVTMY